MKLAKQASRGISYRAASITQQQIFLIFLGFQMRHRAAKPKLYLSCTQCNCSGKDGIPVTQHMQTHHEPLPQQRYKQVRWVAYLMTG